MNTKIQNQIENGASRIDEIKQKISACKSRNFCKAEVYETWDSIFEPGENEQ